jgi:branched-subunit amino acid aminotransferase/4-amino-4-deoxychorismate lyase
MPEPHAYLNGRRLPATDLAVPVWDTGFVQGVTVAEQLRTFAGRLFRLEQHLDRLSDSLAAVGLPPPISMAELERQARDLVAHNHSLLADGDDLGLSLFITPGPYAAFAPPHPGGPTVAMHTYPVPFSMFADKYEQGERLATTDVEQVPAACWPPALKCRSRMHYYLADRQARRVDPQARALMRDHDGFVTEASTANLVLYRERDGLISPPKEKILPGVSIAALEELAAKMGLSFTFREVTVDDVLRSDEAFLCSTSPCLLPVVALNNQAIGGGEPGALFRQLIAAWSQLVGLDIIGQAQKFSSRT